MLVINKNSLDIKIPTTSAVEHRERFIKAISAAVRWFGNLPEGTAYKTDGENLIALSELQESLLMEESD